MVSGQPVKCVICKGAHKAAELPDKNKCHRCHQPGRVVKDCINNKDPLSPLVLSPPTHPLPLGLVVLQDPKEVQELSVVDPKEVPNCNLGVPKVVSNSNLNLEDPTVVHQITVDKHNVEEPKEISNSNVGDLKVVSNSVVKDSNVVHKPNVEDPKWSINLM